MGQGKLGEVILRGTRAAQPLATAVSDGTLYYVTDETVLERSNATAWQSFSASVVTGGITQLTGDVTAGPGSGSVAATIGANKVLTANILDANVTRAKLSNGTALSVIGRSANSSGVPADIAASAASDAVLRESGSALGFGTVAAGGLASNSVTTAKIADSNVTLAKIVDVSAASRLIGRGSAAGAGVQQEIALGSGLSMSGTTLNASAGSSGKIIIWFGQPNSGSGFSPADSLTYYFLVASSVNPTTTNNGPFGPMVTRDGTVTRAYVKVVIGGTLASAQNVTFTVHNNTAATSEAITTTAQLTANPTLASNTAMTLAFTAGDVMQVSMTCPVWTTNPTATFYSFAIEFTPT